MLGPKPQDYRRSHGYDPQEPRQARDLHQLHREVAFSLAFTITNDIPCAEVMLVFPHALRHAATTANRPGNHRGPDSNADLLARHAERLL